MREKADLLAGKLAQVAPNLSVDVVPSVARSGGGTLPLHEIPSYAVRLKDEEGGIDTVAEKLRSANPPVIGRVGEERLWLDVRTLLEGDEDAVLEAVEALDG
jgi:L-seryl-tRNA(Ser) seleniumtransferase